MIAAEDRIARVRSFNRTVTQRVGALDPRYLSRERPLGEARMLWEIGPDGCEVRTLRSRLELDSGHASRLLRALEAAGLVEVSPSPADGRIRIASLTPRGRRERALYDERSDQLAAAFLAPLAENQREELVRAMRTVERLLAAAAIEIRPVDPGHPDVRGCLRAYFADLDGRSETGFDVGTSIPVEPEQVRPPAGLQLVAYRGAEPVGCGSVKHHDGWSEVKRMWVSPTTRGLGLGRRLLGALEAEAVRAGARTTRLDTNHNLVEAISLYRSAGYGEIPPFTTEPFADHWFEKRL